MAPALLRFAPAMLDQPETPRQAAVLFVREAAQAGWGRRELADWLVCHYGPCVTGSDDSPRRSPFPPAEDWSDPSPVTLRESTIGELCAAARMRMIALLEDLRDRDTGESIARSMIARGLVFGERDEHGAVAYLPVNRRQLRLADRLASLFVADYLNFPFDYWRGRVDMEGMLRNSHIDELEVVEEAAPMTRRYDFSA